MDYRLERAKIVQWLREQLIGPSKGQEELLNEISPLDRYPVGALFPIVRTEEGIDPASLTDEDCGLSNDAISDDDEATIKRRRYVPPSSVGFSFFARGQNVEFHIICSAVKYVLERDEGRYSARYERRTLGGDSDVNTFNSTRRIEIWPSSALEEEKLAGIDVVKRPYLDGWIFTVSLFNNQELTGGDYQERSEKTLFEVELKCVFESGEIGNYPRVDRQLLDDEEQELELQFKHRHIYAVGHGAASNWSLKNGRVNEIWSDFMPVTEVPQVTADTNESGQQALNLAYLADTKNSIAIFDTLADFVSNYAEWIKAQKKIFGDLASDEASTALRITNRMDVAIQRMERSIRLLRNNKLVTHAFHIANQAMLDQMRQADINKKKEPRENYEWRPFQLAFILTVLESAIEEDNDFRDMVDLIWFPTGGGKTEAYLGLMALVIAWRRLKFPSSGSGCAILMRYTLRLLTSQQYLRAARMVCALELIRKKNTALGTEPISIGLWVGSATSPNTFKKALGIVQHAINGKTSALNSLVIDCCPWCGNGFKASENYIASDTSFHFRCINDKCQFGVQKGVIPCNVVDEALYKAPPTLLIATIDKYARLAWDERTNSFFGGLVNRPPELIIQDELHLIAGALGSIAGLYEAALDTVLKQKGIHPKFVASTATIRMAHIQVKRLYAREVAVFPPPGLSCDDSYFARTVPLDQRPGRLYVGYLAPTLDRQHCMAPLAAALLAAPEMVFDKDYHDRSDLLEAWWTQIVYHGSLKGVGNSHNAFNVDVREKFDLLTQSVAKNSLERKKNPRLAQLTSISSAEENAKTFALLEKKRDDLNCLDAVLATNMVSVGLDVARLALMIINGQPLTTAEYIQASSRVGRSEIPGLVLTNYFRDQARSLSHYENFRPYHDAFYRFVEPTSVTPYTFQARSRALHAALVIVIRHTCTFLLENDKAGAFNPSADNVNSVIEQLKRRCVMADKERKQEIEAHIDKIVEEWSVAAECKRINKRQFNYQVPSKERSADPLLHNYDDEIKGLWPTLQSMRNVENTALLKSK